MARTLLVTNDFPPRVGGIQAYLHALASRLPAGELVVYAPQWRGAAALDGQTGYPVHRHGGSVMLPAPAVARQAAKLARDHGCETVWFGAAAPLALLAAGLRRRAGIGRVLASTHGHEVSWTLSPGGRQVLRQIGRGVDGLTAVSRYAQSRVAAALAPLAGPAHLPPGVDADTFRPDAAARRELRRRHRLGDRPVVSCVARLVRRKGQDALIAGLRRIRRQAPGAVLLLVGDGPDADRLRRLAAAYGVAEHVVLTGAVPWELLPAYHAVGDVFAMPCRTRLRGLDVEGLGITVLEASASGLPAVVGSSGGAPETVRPGQTGLVVDGRQVDAVAAAVGGLLADPARAARMGAAGRAWMRSDWGWGGPVRLLRTLLDPAPLIGVAGCAAPSAGAALRKAQE